MPRYVVLEHDWPQLHWAFMREVGAALRTSRRAARPAPARATAARRIGDHRLDYLDYEGPLSGNRGRVARWDAGWFAWRADEPETTAVCLEGQRLRGTVILRAAAGDE